MTEEELTQAFEAFHSHIKKDERSAFAMASMDGEVLAGALGSLIAAVLDAKEQPNENK